MGVVRQPSSDPSTPLPVSTSTAASGSGSGSTPPVVPVTEAGATDSRSMKNPDSRPLPEGWDEYYDVEYVFFQATASRILLI
jgi:hypothetical protein